MFIFIVRQHVINFKVANMAAHTNVINYRRLWLEGNLKRVPNVA